MADRRVKVGLELEASGFEAGAKRAQRAAEGLGAATDKLGGQADKAAGGMSKVADSVRSNSADLQTAGTALAAVGAGLTAASVGMGKAAMDWESAFAGVKKTVDDSTEGYAQLEGELRNLATTLPASHQEIAAVAEAAGQLGVKRDDIVGFTSTMVDLGETTNLTADEAATAIAQISNVMGTMDREGSEGVERFGATLVELGNNGASTESEILDMAQRIAGAAKTVGASESDVLALSNTLASMGVRAEQGGGVATRVILKMSAAVDEGGESLESFAQVAGTSAEEFAAKFRSAPMEALDLVAQGIGRVNAEGGNVTATLKDMGIKGTEETQVMLALASAGDLLSESLRMGDEAWASNSALAEEASKRYETAEARIQMAWNQIKDAAIDAGGAILPVAADLAESVATVVGSFTSLPGPVKGAVGAIAGVGGVAAVAGGALLLLAPRAVETYDAFRRLAPEGSKAAGAIGKVGKAAGIATAAIIAMQAVGALISEDHVQSAESMEQALIRTAKAGDDVADVALDDVFKEWATIGGDSRVQVDNMADAIRQIADPSLGQRINENLNFMNGWMNLPDDEVTAMKDRVHELSDSMGTLATAGHADEAAAGFRQLTEEFEKNGVSAQEVFNQYPGYRDALMGIANDAGYAASEQELLEWALTGVEPAALAAQRGAEGAGGAMGDLGTAGEKAAESLGALAQIDADSKVGGIAEAMAVLSDESLELEDRLSGVLDALFRMGILEQTAAEAAASFEAALDGVAAAVEENGATLDITTEAGRNNQAALNDIADAGRGLVTSLAEAGASQGELRDALERTYVQAYNAATAMGATSEEAEILARRAVGLNDMSVDIDTYLSDAALIAAEATGQAIEAIPGYKGVSVVVSDEGTTGTIQSRINDVTGKTEYVHVSDDGSTTTVQQQIHNIAGVDRTVWVDDAGTVYGTQQDIYAITGKDVDVSAIPHTSAAENALNYAARNRTVSIFAKYVGMPSAEDRTNWARNNTTGIFPNRAKGGIASLPGYSTGGRLPYTGLGTDMILGVTGAGMPIARVDDGEWIINQKASKKFHGVLSAINRGDPSVRHLAGYAGGGRPGREWSATSINPVVNVTAPAGPGVDVNAIASAVVAGVAALPAPRIVFGERQVASVVRESLRYAER